MPDRSPTPENEGAAEQRDDLFAEHHVNDAEDGVTANAANVRRAVFDAEVEYKLALQTLSDEDAAWHRDEILTKWLTNLGVLPASGVAGSVSGAEWERPDYDGEICQDCKLPVVRCTGSWWHAPDALWRQVTGADEGVLCPPCFTARADEIGVRLHWVPTLESGSVSGGGAGEYTEADEAAIRADERQKITAALRERGRAWSVYERTPWDDAADLITPSVDAGKGERQCGKCGTVESAPCVACEQGHDRPAWGPNAVRSSREVPSSPGEGDDAR